MDGMKCTIREFLDIAATIAGERKFDRLMTHVLKQTLPATGSRAGAIYLVDDDGISSRRRHKLSRATEPNCL